MDKTPYCAEHRRVVARLTAKPFDDADSYSRLLQRSTLLSIKKACYLHGQAAERAEREQFVTKEQLEARGDFCFAAGLADKRALTEPVVTNSMAIIDLRRRVFAANAQDAGMHNCDGGWVCEGHPHVRWPHDLSEVGCVGDRCAWPGQLCDYPGCND